MPIFNENIRYWLAATRSHGIGPVKFREGLAFFPDIKTLFLANSAELTCAGFTPTQIEMLKNPDWQAVTRDLRWSEKVNCYLIALEDPSYPFLLRETVSAPLVLYVRGSLDAISEPQIAIVGSRNPTVTGRECAEQFGYYLGQAGLIVTSGLALGVDAASHRGALSAKSKTIAVAGTGLNQIYPSAHKKLAEDIVRTGAMVSEFPPETPPIAKNFPRRNRIISGLSLGVLVVEAALRSGSLITARYAMEQGREVFALPGSIHNPLARGCHQLIRQGAKLTETAEDILEELGSLKQASFAEPTEKAEVSAPNLEPKQQELLAHIGYNATALDTVMIRSGLTASEVSSMLLSLELRGYVNLVAGGYARTSSR